jgi:tetratricopeptide (TPR) repeat protein
VTAVVRKPEAEFRSALDRLLAAGLLFSQGVPPYATYLFKHALVQDAAYGTLLREPRRSLHARIAETLESQFPEIAESQPELLARHYTEAGLIEKAARLWGTAGQRSLGRSALVEAAEQLTRALAQIDTLPATPDLRREQIKLQVALIPPLIWVKGPTTPETIAAAERACLLVEQAEARGEPPDDPLIQFSVLYGLWVAVPFNGDVCRGLAAQFLALAAKQQTTAPRLIGHRMMGHTLFHTGEFVEAKAHFDKGLALYNAAEHRPLATRFWVDSRIVILCWRSLAAWVLGYPAAAISDSDQAVGDGRDIGQAASLMYALILASFTHTFCGNYATATALVNEVTPLADEKGSLITKAIATLVQAEIFALNDNAAAALQSNIDGLNTLRLTGQTIFIPIYLSWLARTYAKLGKFDDAWRCIGEA